MASGRRVVVGVALLVLAGGFGAIVRGQQALDTVYSHVDETLASRS